MRAQIRFLVLASLYRDWCQLVWDEVHDDSPGMWLDLADVDHFHVGQLCGSDEHLAVEAEENFELVLRSLMEMERTAVVEAVLNGFGGTSALFIALWRSREEVDEVSVDDDDAGRSKPDEETEDDILNDGSLEKLAGFQWIEEGCPNQGPVRSRGEMDL